jgi:DNA polymerase/3'-5' exonuclease PolX
MDHKDIITFNLSTLVKKYKKTDRFKASAYSKALTQLPSAPILSFDDVSKVGGDKTKQKLKYIIENNKNLQEVDDYLNDSTFVIIDTLQTVHGIGPTKAQDLYEKHNIRSIEDLKKNIVLLNNIQRMGLEHYDDMQKKIPFKEMVKHENFLTTNLKNIEFKIAGSYRRKSPQSSDIDVLITGTTNELDDVISLLQNIKYINSEAIFAKGEVKFMGLCKLPRHKVFRRIDILYTTRNEYPFALLYFTGNYKFNVDMRKQALTKGFSLNEQGLKSLNNEPIKKVFVKEEDIFEFLEYPYTKPEERVV